MYLVAPLSRPSTHRGPGLKAPLSLASVPRQCALNPAPQPLSNFDTSTVTPCTPASGPGAHCRPDPPGASLRTGTLLWKTALGRHPHLLHAGLAISSLTGQQTRSGDMYTAYKPGKQWTWSSLSAHGNAPCGCTAADLKSLMHGAASAHCSSGSCLALHEAAACS